MLAVLAQYEAPEVPGPPMVELLYSFAIPVWSAIFGYALALALARPHRRDWLAQGSTMLALVVVLGAGFVGNFAHHTIAGFVADATDDRHGTLEAVVAIGFTVAVMPYCVGRVFRLGHPKLAAADASGESRTD